MIAPSSWFGPSRPVCRPVARAGARRPWSAPDGSLPAAADPSAPCRLIVAETLPVIGDRALLPGACPDA